MRDGSHLLMPVRSDGVQEPRRIRGVVVHRERFKLVSPL